MWETFYSCVSHSHLPVQYGNCIEVTDCLFTSVIRFLCNLDLSISLGYPHHWSSRSLGYIDLLVIQISQLSGSLSIQISRYPNLLVICISRLADCLSRSLRIRISQLPGSLRYLVSYLNLSYPDLSAIRISWYLDLSVIWILPLFGWNIWISPLSGCQLVSQDFQTTGWRLCKWRIRKSCAVCLLC